MKKKLIAANLFLLLLIGISCTKDDLSVPEELKVNNFIWKGLNQYYLWQTDVPNLADDRFANQDALNDFLSGYSNPTTLFNSLRVDSSIDRFSVIYSDYDVLEGILSGNTLNNGVDFGLRYKNGSSTDIFGWVRYILPNSNASTQNIQRGDLFYAVNGTPLTASNYQSLLSATTYTLNLADYDNGNITPNGQSVTLTKTQLAENPVYAINTFVQGNKKIGYLMYNGFYSQYENQLNDAFGQLKAQNITHLVLDLRYNSGGSIATATRLASLITGQFTGSVFAKQQWNAKLDAYWLQNNPSSIFNYFTTTTGSGSVLNSLNLTKVYILTTKSTASASELVINGLKSYIDVIQIGDTTTGKNVGSVTLYDSPNFGKSGANPNHKYAMQPIVLKTVNADGFGDYQNGLTATIQQLEDYGNLGVIGDATEPLLATAINQIITSGRIMQQPEKTFMYCSDSKTIEPLRSEMYIELK
ncbi:S41 family peptidase [Flavobacterium sp.]|uniref:S41 family peptidase n=1 Tax=Flavobacterium sp. TaxID=239 RepID=UPI002B4B7B34|nr:S41 family peptidase [Flavobacterium sp.]HLP63817.1 S41 family peptidase [Flavobacterium sp.]